MLARKYLFSWRHLEINSVLLLRLRALSCVFLNWILFTMSMRSASNLSRSLCCGGHFRDLSPYLPSVSASASVGRFLSSEFFP